FLFDSGLITFTSSFVLALRYSHRGRVTFLLQLKKVTKKSRHYNVALKNRVPIETALSSCCEKTRKRRSDSFHRKPMMAGLFRWLVEGG
ncbi:MAG: hypothetical protein V3U87_05125, partial [Methylococcaceae bacterium]